MQLLLHLKTFPYSYFYVLSVDCHFLISFFAIFLLSCVSSLFHCYLCCFLSSWLLRLFSQCTWKDQHQHSQTKNTCNQILMKMISIMMIVKLMIMKHFLLLLKANPDSDESPPNVQQLIWILQVLEFLFLLLWLLSVLIWIVLHLHCEWLDLLLLQQLKTVLLFQLALWSSPPSAPAPSNLPTMINAPSVPPSQNIQEQSFNALSSI